MFLPSDRFVVALTQLLVERDAMSLDFVGLRNDDSAFAHEVEIVRHGRRPIRLRKGGLSARIARLPRI